MACVWIEGFESHTNSNQVSRKYAASSGTFTPNAPRVAGSSAAMTSAVAVTPVIASGNTFVVGFGVRYTSHNASINSGNQGLYIESGAAEQCHLEIESTSGQGIRFLLKRGSTVVDTSTYIDFGVWHYVELKVTVRTGTNGVWELRHNGVDIMSGNTDNLADSGSDGWNIFAFRYSTSLNLRYDDMYVLDGTGAKNLDFLGPSIVEGIDVEANGVTNNFTASSGSANYTHVDDAGSSTPDDVSAGGYVGSDTNTDKELYAFTDLAQITGTIHAVQVGVQMAMATAATRTVKTVYRDPDTTEADGDSHVVAATDFDEFTQVFDDNPRTAAAWDVTDIDDGQFGFEVVS